MPSLDPILKKLACAQQALLRVAEAVPAELWKTVPQEGCWSAAEVIAHIMTVECAVIAAASRILRKEPKRIAMHKRLRLPFALVEMRLIRLKTPIPVDEKLIKRKEAMLEDLAEVRGRTLELMEQTKERDLSAYRWSHPFLGSLNAYDWFALLASHQIRHEKQLREICARLPKAISDLQK